MRRVPELDGLRGLAILLVVVWHYIAITLPPAATGMEQTLRRPLALAWSGVDLFFVLSGFLIGGILLDESSSPRYFGTFYGRRFCRIFPLYYLWLAAFFVGVALVGTGASDWLSRLFNLDLPALSYPVYLQNVWMTTRRSFGAQWVGVTWSLAIEEQFYLLLPFMVRALSRRGLAIVVGLAVMAAPIARVLVSRHDTLFGPYTLLPCRFDSLGLGVLIALASRDQRVWAWLGAHRRAFQAALALLFIGVLFLTGHSQGRLMNSIGYTWLAVFYACALVLAIANPGSRTRAMLGARPLQELGTLAYGVYLFHLPMNWIAHGCVFGRRPKLDGVASVGVTALTAAASIALARLSWRFFEKPIVARGHARFRY